MEANIKVQGPNGPEMHKVDFRNNTVEMTDASGVLVKMDLGQQDVHIDAALANYAAGFKQVSGVADLVAPVVPVTHASNKFFAWDKDDVFQDHQDLIVGSGGAIKEIGPRLGQSSYATVSYGIGSFVPTEVQGNADSPLSPLMAATNRLMNVIHLARERRVAALLTTSGNWSGGTVANIAAGAKWNGGASSNPIQDIFTAIEASLTPVKAIVMAENVWHDFVQNAAVQKYTGYKSAVAPLPDSILSPKWDGSFANGAGMSPDQFTAMLGLPPIYVGFMKGKLTSTTYGYVWGANVPLIYNQPALPSDGQSISTAYTFRWNAPDAPDGTVQGGFLFRSYFDPRRGSRGGKVIAVVHNDAEVMTSTVAGGLLSAVHQ